LRALLDTGADCTLLPRAVALALALPRVDEVAIEGITSASQRVPVYAARLALQGASRLARVVAYGHEAILGRDLLNGHCVLLDGPRLTLSFRAPRAGQRRTGRKARAKT
jgi:predicted aspartyl protease